MNRASKLINGFIMAFFFMIPPQVLAKGKQCTLDIEKVKVTTKGKGNETKVNLNGPVNLSLPLMTIGGQSRYESLSISAQRDDLWELVYYAGQAGTSYLVEEFWKVIIDPCQNKVLGESALYSVPMNEEDEAEWEQPQWVWGSDNLYIVSNGYGNETIPLSPEHVSGRYQFQDYKTAFNPKMQWQDVLSVGSDHHHPKLIKKATKGEAYPNFGGKFKLLYFGCGTGCSGIGILDKESGTLFEPEFVVHKGINQTERMIQFRVDSRLIIITGALNEGGEQGVYYFHFDGEKLIKLP